MLVGNTARKRKHMVCKKPAEIIPPDRGERSRRVEEAGSSSDSTRVEARDLNDNGKIDLPRG